MSLTMLCELETYYVQLFMFILNLTDVQCQDLVRLWIPKDQSLPRFATVKMGVPYKNSYIALAGVAQWIECQPVNQTVTGLIPR